MEEYGVVLRTHGRLADVGIRQSSACAKCGKCELAHETKDLTVSAVNSIAASAGDKVSLQMEHRDLLSAGLIAYGLPLAALFLGVAIGEPLLGQAGAALLGFFGVALTYSIIHWIWEPKFKSSQRYNVRITRIVNEWEVDLGDGSEH